MISSKQLRERDRLKALASLSRCQQVMRTLAEPSICDGRRVGWSWLAARLAVLKARLTAGDSSDAMADEAEDFADSYLNFIAALTP